MAKTWTDAKHSNSILAVIVRTHTFLKLRVNDFGQDSRTSRRISSPLNIHEGKFYSVPLQRESSRQAGGRKAGE